MSAVLAPETTWRYTVSAQHDCRVVTGVLPLSEAAILLHGWSTQGEEGTDDEWIVDALIAEHVRANLVCGPRWAILAWRTELIGDQIAASSGQGGGG